MGHFPPIPPPHAPQIPHLQSLQSPISSLPPIAPTPFVHIPQPHPITPSYHQPAPPPPPHLPPPSPPLPLYQHFRSTRGDEGEIETLSLVSSSVNRNELPPIELSSWTS